MSVFYGFGWFVSGVIVGGAITVRALKHRPTPADLRRATINTGADLLDLAAKALRAPHRR